VPGPEPTQDIAAAMQYMRGQDYVDANRAVLLGLSTGGWGSVAAAGENLPGVVGTVAFGAGHGVFSPRQVCDAPALVAAADRFGATTSIPVLWM
jgi:dienelactone hydrolase